MDAISPLVLELDANAVLSSTIPLLQLAQIFPGLMPRSSSGDALNQTAFPATAVRCSKISHSSLHLWVEGAYLWLHALMSLATPSRTHLKHGTLT